MLIFSKILNRKWIYRIVRFHTVIITIYLSLNFFFDVSIFAGIKYNEFPDLYSLKEDPLFNYSDKKLSDVNTSLKRYFFKDTEIFDLSLINYTIFNTTYLEYNNNQIYVPDPQYFKISFDDEIKGDLKPYQKRHRSEFNGAMILVLINICLDILSLLLWNSIRFKHKKLIQNKVIKKFGKKIVYTGYVKLVRVFKVFVAYISDKTLEEIALMEVRQNENYIPDVDINSCSLCLFPIIELFGVLGSFFAFIFLIIEEDDENFNTRSFHFPFTLTFFGDGLYTYLITFLIVIFVIDCFFILGAEMIINHHKYMHTDYRFRVLASLYMFIGGIVNLFFSICGVIGVLFFIVGMIDSNGKLYIKTACVDSDISCYGLFQFASSFQYDTQKKYSIIFYYIYLKKSSESELKKNIAKLIVIFLIYFSHFFVFVFDNLIKFNFDKIRFGKCMIHDLMLKEKGNKNGEIDLLDYVSAKIEDNEDYYKNGLTDSYFGIFNNNNNIMKNNKANEINKREDVQIVQNNNKNISPTSERPTNINPTAVIIVTSNNMANI